MTYEPLNLAPGSPEHLALRTLGLGTSDFAAIMGVSPYLTYMELWRVKTNRQGDAFVHPGMIRGNAEEPAARAALEEYLREQYGLVVHFQSRIVRSANWTKPPLFCQLDADSCDEQDIVAEIKVPYEREHLLALHGMVPPKHVPQIQGQWMVRQPKRHFFASWNPDMGSDRHLAVIETTHDPDYCLRLCQEIKAFWKYVEDDQEPPPSERDVRYLDDEHDGGEYARLAAEWIATKQDLEEAELRETEANDALKRYCRDIHPRVRGAGIIYTRSEVRGSVDWAAAERAGVVNPAVADQFRKPSRVQEVLRLEKLG